MEYIHYGTDKFNPALVSTEENHFRKPAGLWASPTDTNWGWKDWCLAEDFHTGSLNKFFKFTLKPCAKILVVNGLDDVMDYLDIIETEFKYLPDIRLKRKELYRDFDGMMVWMSHNWNELHNNILFNLWDVDSIVVWNLDVIIPL